MSLVDCQCTDQPPTAACSVVMPSPIAPSILVSKGMSNNEKIRTVACSFGLDEFGQLSMDEGPLQHAASSTLDAGDHAGEKQNR